MCGLRRPRRRNGYRRYATEEHTGAATRQRRGSARDAPIGGRVIRAVVHGGRVHGKTTGDMAGVRGRYLLQRSGGRYFKKGELFLKSR